MKNIDIIGGGTVYHVRNHLALTAPAYGETAHSIYNILQVQFNRGELKDYWPHLYLTKMAGGKLLETNEDVSKLVDTLIANPDTKIIIFNPALVDYEGSVVDFGKPCSRDLDSSFVEKTVSGKYESRLKTSEGEQVLQLWPAEKILRKIRKERKDIFLVAFKTTCGASEDEQFLTGLHLLKSNSCNLVLANDTKTRVNMIITPEQARYHVSTDRNKVLESLVKMTLSRSQGTFTRSKIIDGPPVPWAHEVIPNSLRTVVDHCITKGAYKPFNGATVGHFALKVSDNKFITSKRKVNFNDLNSIGMVMCRTGGKMVIGGKNLVLAFGAKPSVGGQSQRIIFQEHPEMDCIVHFHCPTKPTANLSVRQQEMFECGSHECGKNTSDGLRSESDDIKCVYLDNHGPNIVFNRNANPQKIIEFIESNFDLSKSTDGVDRTKSTVV